MTVPFGSGCFPPFGSCAPGIIIVDDFLGEILFFLADGPVPESLRLFAGVACVVGGCFVWLPVTALASSRLV